MASANRNKLLQMPLPPAVAGAAPKLKYSTFAFAVWGRYVRFHVIVNDGKKWHTIVGRLGDQRPSDPPIVGAAHVEAMRAWERLLAAKIGGPRRKGMAR